MSKVFAQLAPAYKDRVTFLEVDINIEENNSLIDKYRVMTIPTSVLLDSQGEIIEKASGFISLDEMQAKLNKL